MKKIALKFRNYLFVLILLTFGSVFSYAQVFEDNTGGNIADAYWNWNWSITSTWQEFDLDVSGVGTIDCNFSLCIDISHSFTADLDIVLFTPNEIIYEVSTDNGLDGDNYTNTCFTMDANTSIAYGTAPFDGDYIPEGNSDGTNFDDLIGEDANGTWTLFIGDDWPGIEGTLNSWSLDFTCNVENQEDCDVEEEQYTLNLIDSYGDGWYAGYGNNTHTVEINGISYGEDFSNSSIANTGLVAISYTLFLCPSDCIDISFINGGNWSYECSFNLVNSSGVTVFNGNDQTNDQTICLFEGCTDPLACNFDPDAEDDDGSCWYSPLTVDECEAVYCDSESGEQFTSSTPIEYLTIPITESGTLNQLYYNINWHSQDWCDNPGEQYSGVRINLYDQSNQLVSELVNLSQGCPIPNYVNFNSIDLYDLTVENGYYIQVEAWRQFPGWQSYINLADISFTVITELVSAGNDFSHDICYDDDPINLFDFLGPEVTINGTWSPSLTGGYLGTFDPQLNNTDTYIYSIQNDCNSEQSNANVNVIIISPSEIEPN